MLRYIAVCLSACVCVVIARPAITKNDPDIAKAIVKRWDFLENLDREYGVPNALSNKF